MLARCKQWTQQAATSYNHFDYNCSFSYSHIRLHDVLLPCENAQVERYIACSVLMVWPESIEALHIHLSQLVFWNFLLSIAMDGEEFTSYCFLPPLLPRFWAGMEN